jgi:hypothetical protein
MESGGSEQADVTDSTPTKRTAELPPPRSTPLRNIMTGLAEKAAQVQAKRRPVGSDRVLTICVTSRYLTALPPSFSSRGEPQGVGSP